MIHSQRSWFWNLILV